LTKRLHGLIERLETQPLHWGYTAATFFAIVIVRNIIEGALGPTGAIGFTYFSSSSAMMVLDHFVLFYTTLFLAFSLLLSCLARERVGRVMKVATPAWLLVLIPPVLDYLISGGAGIKITYVSELGNVVLRFFDPRASLEYISPGQRVEILAACLLGGAYVRVKARSWPRAFVGFFGIYAILAVVGFLPSAFARLSAYLSGAGAVPARLAYDLAYKTGGIVPDESRKLALLFLFSSLLLGWAAYARHAPEKARAMLRGYRPLRSAHYVGLTLFGAAFAAAIFLQAGVRIAGGGDVLGLLAALAATFLAFQSSAAVNDVFDAEGDRIAGNTRPLATNELSRKDVVGQAIVLGTASLLLALNVKYSTFLTLLLAYSVSLVYSMPPLRLKRVPLVSTLSLGLISFLTALTGFSLFAEERALALFPPRLAWVLVLSFGLGFAAKDLKDVEGDRATGVATLPVLLGPERGRAAIAALVFISYALIPCFLEQRVLVAPSIVLAAASAAIALRWRKRNLDRVLLAICLAFTLFVAVVVVLNAAEAANVSPRIAGAKAAERHAGRAWARRDWPRAIAYAEAAEASPRMPYLQERAGVALFESRQDEEAIRFLERALSLDPSSPITREYLSAALARDGREDLAYGILREAVARGIRPRVFLSLVGESRLRVGDPGGAVAWFERALATGQPDIPARLRLAEALRATGETGRAARELVYSVERHPSSPQAHDALGKFLNTQRDHELAANAFRRAVELDPGEPTFWNNLGVALRLDGRYAEALAALDEATRLAPRMVDPYYNRGEIARATGREEEARRQFLLALEIDPSFRPARAALEGAALID